MLQQEGTLKIVAHGALEMPNVETLGKQDPYLQFTLDLNDKSSWQKSHTQKNAGKNANWNQSFEIPLRGERELYVEVMDEETGVDELIGFAAIPIAPVAQAPGGHINGLFDLYTVKGKSGGVLHLSLTVHGFNSPPPGYGQPPAQPVRGQSYVNEEHAKRCKSLRNKAIAGDVGTAVLGGALAIGAGLLGNKLYQDHERKEQEEQEQREQMEREKQRMEEERARMDREREEMERRRREQEEQSQNQYHHQHEEHHHHHHQHRQEHGYGGAREWDPVGTYAPGDRVEYHGRTYVCLQGHTSNPTWMPGAAHSLWQAQ